MIAAVYEKYGSPYMLELKEVPDAIPILNRDMAGVKWSSLYK